MGSSTAPGDRAVRGPVPGGGRLGRPVVRQPLVRRQRLAEMLDAGVRRSVTLVCAGPGWGKTMLVASWAEARAVNGPIAWLTLCTQHNDPRVFWSDLMLALRLRLVLVARTEPSLPLHRFRAAGDLTEIRARHLAFRAPEAAELPVLHRRRLPACCGPASWTRCAGRSRRR